MLDPLIIKAVNKPLNSIASVLKNRGVNKDLVTITGFVLGISSVFLLYFHFYKTALFLIMLNRLFDGLDGAIARITTPTDAGGFLDITLDFIFYSGVVLGFGLSDPENNAAAASFLLFSFVGTGSSFLAFSIMAEKNRIKSRQYPDKSLYFSGGLVEGTETIIFFIFFCLFPHLFSILAIVFSILCWLTTCIRIYTGYRLLRA